MIKWIVPFCMVVTLFSCEKNISFNLDEAPNVLVVDAQIENGVPPSVVLTKSFSFFDSINPQILSNSFVHNAVVTLSNGNITQQLKERAYLVAPGLTVYVYGIDSANLANAFLGQFNTNYTMNITAEGKQYTANTSITTLAKNIDSVWWEPAPFADDANNVVLKIKATDPLGLGNYIRYFTRINRQPFLPGENSVFDDQVIDGKTYELQVDPGIDRNNMVSRDSNFFKRGDTVTLKLCNINKSTYQYWNTWEFAFQSIGNPFAQPNKVIGNISNGALGAFYGYAAEYRSLIIPK